MATDLVMEPALAPAVPSRPRLHCRLHYRGLEVSPAALAVVDAPRAGRRMFWRGVVFDGALLDAEAPAVCRGPQFYRGGFF